MFSSMPMRTYAEDNASIRYRPFNDPSVPAPPIDFDDDGYLPKDEFVMKRINSGLRVTQNQLRRAGFQINEEGKLIDK